MYLHLSPASVLIALGNLGLVFIIFANWHDAKLYRRGQHWWTLWEGEVSLQVLVWTFFLACSVTASSMQELNEIHSPTSFFWQHSLGSLVSLSSSPAGSHFVSISANFSPHNMPQSHPPHEKSRGSKGALVHITFSSLVKSALVPGQWLIDMNGLFFFLIILSKYHWFAMLC